MEWLHRLRMARSSPWLGILPPGWGFDLHKRNIWNGKKYQQRDLLKSTSHCRPLEDFPSAILDRQTWQWREHFGQLGWTWTWKGKIFGTHAIKQFNKCTKHWMNIHRHPLFLEDTGEYTCTWPLPGCSSCHQSWSNALQDGALLTAGPFACNTERMSLHLLK